MLAIAAVAVGEQRRGLAGAIALVVLRHGVIGQRSAEVDVDCIVRRSRTVWLADRVVSDEELVSEKTANIRFADGVV